MRPLTFMVIAGEASGDLLAAELVDALRVKVLELELQPTTDLQPRRTALLPRFLGAGGSRMADAGVELALDMTQHAVIGLAEPLRKLRLFKRMLDRLVARAVAEKPDVIVCVDFFGFNHRFAHAIRQHVRKRLGWFQPWNPKIVQYVSPQVWASRPGRARRLAIDYDLVLSILPFEKAWYAEHAPGVRVEFVGHPICDRFSTAAVRAGQIPSAHYTPHYKRTLVLLPGSRPDEVRRHLPVMFETLSHITRELPQCEAVVVLPNESLVELAKTLGVPDRLRLQCGGLQEALAQATLAIAKSGTVTLECALFGLPTIVIYKTSWPTYLVGKLCVTVKYLAMPNLLAGEEVMPEFIQAAAIPQKIARAAVELMTDPARYETIKRKLIQVTAQLGVPGASSRAAQAILNLLQ